MPTFDYTASDGRTFEEFFLAGEPVPDTIERDGTVFHKSTVYVFRTRRSIGGENAHPRSGVRQSSKFPRFESSQLPRRMRGDTASLAAKAAKGNARAQKTLDAIRSSDKAYEGFERQGGTFSDTGKPQVSNLRQAQEIASSMGDGGDKEVSYGDL